MFEKEAKAYKEIVMKEHLQNPFPRSVEDVWQDGAEFGYNKANEWHKADVPTSPINKIVLGYIKDYNSKSFCLVKWNGEWWYDARTWNDKVKLIAWKEIVLPELKGE